MKPIIAIDPGASGGIAWRDNDGVVDVEPMPEGMTAQIDFLRSLIASLPNADAVIEKVGTYMPGNSGPASCTFARHCGHLEAALYALGCPAKAVLPRTWMQTMGSLPKDKADRKRAIKEEMQRRYPALSVTLKTADALGLLVYHIGVK